MDRIGVDYVTLALGAAIIIVYRLIALASVRRRTTASMKRQHKCDEIGAQVCMNEPKPEDKIEPVDEPEPEELLLSSADHSSLSFICFARRAFALGLLLLSSFWMIVRLSDDPANAQLPVDGGQCERFSNEGNFPSESVGVAASVYVTAPVTVDSEPSHFLESNVSADPMVSDSNSLALFPVDLLSVDLHRLDSAVSNEGNQMYYKSAYYGTVQVGTPAQEFTVVFDTGSGHLVLPSRYCHTEACRMHNRYSRSKSSSALDMDLNGSIIGPDDERDQMKVSFGTGEVTGVFIEELVCVDRGSALEEWTEDRIQEATDSQLQDVGCIRMRFIAATHMSDDPFKSFAFDGILGLGLPGASRSADFNFLNVLAKSMSIPQVFSVFLSATNGKQSELTFGGYKEEHLTEDVSWNDVLSPEHGHWMVAVTALKIDGETLDYCNDGTCKAVVDTGTSLLGVPLSSFAELYTGLWHPSQLDGVCLGNGPRLSIELDHFTVELDPEDYAQGTHYNARQMARQLGAPTSWGASRFISVRDGEQKKYGQIRNDVQCKPTLLSMEFPLPMGPKLFILGEPVLRKYSTVYDVDNARVGFGRADQSLSPEIAEELKQFELEEADEMVWFWEDDEDYSETVAEDAI